MDVFFMKIKNIYRSIEKRIPQYQTYDDMPSLLVFVSFASAGLMSGYFSLVLAKVLPMYIEAANAAKELGPVGTAIGLLLLAIMFVVYYFGEIALRFRKILRDRWFK
jgi:hypothetical protein